MPRDETPVLICDLDGTILHANSFPLWVAYLIAGPLPGLGFHARIRLSSRVRRLLLRRKLGRIDHTELLRGIQEAWYEAGGRETGAAADRVQALLRRRVRPAFEPLLRQIAMGEMDAVMATAAAGEYAIRLGRQLGFGHVLATPCRLARDETLNARGNKLIQVLEFLTRQYWAERPIVLLTDHLDDLPLIRHSDAVGWFGSARAMAQASALANGTKFVLCQRLDGTQMLQALAEMSAHARSVAGSASASASRQRMSA
jgi:phosphoserine phosphatase